MTAWAGKVKGARDLFTVRVSSTSRSRRRLRRRLSAGLLLLVGLLLAGGLAAWKAASLPVESAQA